MPILAFFQKVLSLDRNEIGVRSLHLVEPSSRRSQWNSIFPPYWLSFPSSTFSFVSRHDDCIQTFLIYEPKECRPHNHNFQYCCICALDYTINSSPIFVSKSPTGEPRDYVAIFSRSNMFCILAPRKIRWSFNIYPEPGGDRRMVGVCLMQSDNAISACAR